MSRWACELRALLPATLRDGLAELELAVDKLAAGLGELSVYDWGAAMLCALDILGGSDGRLAGFMMGKLAVLIQLGHSPEEARAQAERDGVPDLAELYGLADPMVPLAKA